MALVAFLAFSQTVSADGTLTGVYAQGVQLAEQTYKQGTEVLNEARGKKPEETPQQLPESEGSDQ